jgi:hypothetical protein
MGTAAAAALPLGCIGLRGGICPAVVLLLLLLLLGLLLSSVTAAGLLAAPGAAEAGGSSASSEGVGRWQQQMSIRCCAYLQIGSEGNTAECRYCVVTWLFSTEHTESASAGWHVLNRHATDIAMCAGSSLVCTNKGVTCTLHTGTQKNAQPSCVEHNRMLQIMLC